MYKNFTKPLLDKTLASILYIATLPLTGFIAICIKLESDGPVVFTQHRTGLHGTQFEMRKFRSMTTTNNIRDTSKENEITKVGKILRATSLDEIPQLLNVLRGEMSFIGPRPWIPEYYEHMTKKQRQRADVLPGITGLAQAYGRNSLTITQKINYDIHYVKKISFKQDIKIVLITIRTVFQKSAQEIAKSGIHSELAILKKQLNTETAENKSSNIESET